ncbi:MAG TPA: VOC family protein [Jatrophihabitans sp.]|jgi:catechol 2,3-dioxygenase-like lactoylglutathione lyase family enzyme|uniref:VOC family protein n=1 Tax=Jatrophihabitans sp. TaxID=1932789 RepID=UPI002EDDF69D
MPVSTTLDHVTIVAEDFQASRAVYDALLGCLGLAPTVDFEDPEGDSDDTNAVAAVGYSDAAGRLLLWLVAGTAATTGAHLALAVTEPALVRAVHATAREAGIPVVQAPRDWESDRLQYYGTQLSDPAGNRVEVLLRHPGRS